MCHKAGGEGESPPATRGIMVDLLQVSTSPPASVVGQLFGSLTVEMRRRHIAGRPPLYGDATPTTLEGCIEKVALGEWHPIVWWIHDILAGMHWLHDFHHDISWCAVYILPEMRGQLTDFVKKGVRPLILQAVSDLGYNHVFSGVLPTSRQVLQWAIDIQGSFHAGTYPDWIMVNGEPSAAEIFSHFETDVDMAMVEAARRAVR